MSCCHLMSPITKVTGFVNFKVIVIYRGLSFLIRGAPRAIKMGDFGKQGDWHRGPLCTPGPRPAPSSGRFGETRFAKDKVPPSSEEHDLPKTPAGTSELAGLVRTVQT